MPNSKGPPSSLVQLGAANTRDCALVTHDPGRTGWREWPSDDALCFAPDVLTRMFTLCSSLCFFPSHEPGMRRPTQIERLYLDFDGFFASVEQLAHPHLRGRPVGVVPFAGAEQTCVIACSREAKLRGVKNVMTIAEARARCREILLVP